MLWRCYGWCPQDYEYVLKASFEASGITRSTSEMACVKVRANGGVFAPLSLRPLFGYGERGGGGCLASRNVSSYMRHERSHLHDRIRARIERAALNATTLRALRRSWGAAGRALMRQNASLLVLR